MSDNSSVNFTPFTDDERASSIDGSTADISRTLIPRYSLSYTILKINVLCLCIAPWSDFSFLRRRAKLVGVPDLLRGITSGPIRPSGLYVFQSSVLPAFSDTDITTTFKPSDQVPPFRPHAFWNALSSTTGHPVAKLAVVCHHPKFDVDKSVADGILNEALPCLTISTLDIHRPVPPDITVALSGVGYLGEDNNAIAKEWQFFSFPNTDMIPTCRPGSSPPRAQSAADGPTKDTINNAPHLHKSVVLHKEPSPVLDSPPPGTGKHQSAKKRKAKPKAPKSLTTIGDESTEDEAPPSKHPKTSGKGKETEPNTPLVTGRLCSSTKAETAGPKPKKGLSSVDEQIESMILEIRAKLREMMTEKKKQGFRYIRHSETHYTLMLSAFQGHRTYIPNNMFGPAPPPKEKDKLPKEPLVELVRFSVIEYKQVLQPPGTCLLCLMYGITCNPTVFGLACTHCNQKKLHILCDHTWRADKVHEVMGGIEELREIMFPDAPIVPNMIPHLIEQVSTTRDLYSSLHIDLTKALCAFFSSVRSYVAVSGEEAFRQEFKSTLPHVTTRGQINLLIHAFNHYHKPKMAYLPLKQYKFSDDEKDDAGPSKSPAKKVVLKVKLELGGNIYAVVMFKTSSDFQKFSKTALPLNLIHKSAIQTGFELC
ncbi:hypothetical protein B0H14DRAFT_2655504 [Mycena olivaceomarginata]|nr:hypothetical protein B0H14DRAFT_2655504 [Mycena olivaceomarginata]